MTVVAVFVFGVRAYAQKPEAIDTTYCITQTDEAFLSYYYAANGFDSISVQYRIGELTLRNADSVVRLFQSAESPYNYFIQHSDARVHQERLDSMMRWKPERVPRNAELRFMRMIYTGGFDKDTNWHIEDRTVFKLEARDPITDSVMWVADSVMIDSGATEAQVQPSGTEAGVVYRTVQVPSTLYGRRVVFVVSIDRYGPSPFGLEATRESSDFNLSLMYQANDVMRMNESDIALLEEKRYHIWMTLAEYTFSAACIVPNMHLFAFGDGYADSVKAKFYEAVQGSTERVWDPEHKAYQERTKYIPKPCTAKPSTVFGVAAITFDDDTVGGSNSLNTQVLEVDVDGYDITIDVDRHGIPRPLSLCVIHSGGQEQGGKVYRTLPVGETRLRLTVDKGTPKPWVVLGRGIKGRTVFAITIANDK